MCLGGGQTDPVKKQKVQSCCGLCRREGHLGRVGEIQRGATACSGKPWVNSESPSPV